jgi:hypothetical protein
MTILMKRVVEKLVINRIVSTLLMTGYEEVRFMILRIIRIKINISLTNCIIPRSQAN